MAPTLSGYRRALDLFEDRVGGVPGDRWSAPSPCDRWTAREVAGHMISGQYAILALATGWPAPDAGGAGAGGVDVGAGGRPGEFATGDVLSAWHTARKECDAALTPEALRRPIPFGALGELPLIDFLGAYVLEPLVHAWDLARATGQPDRLDQDLVHHAFATAHVVAAGLRAAGRLGPALPPPPRADEQTRLLAFLGRAAGEPAG
ncbi:TIGR03086 family metal-binding protein [Spirillospora sp. NPDC029432]|uniref:TIGR03086 family metal-binding protein n=1 Tax=Spirillospora sp. NPDC029432 TaxID=3154599 RepID=UPI003451280B